MGSIGALLHYGPPMNSSVSLRQPAALNAASAEFLCGQGLLRNIRQFNDRRARQGGNGIGSPVCYLNPLEADKEKEQARMFRRLVYDHESWTRHRSSTRHLRHILSISSSRVILSLGPPVYSLTLFSGMVAVYNELVADHWIALPSWAPLLQISALPFQLTAPALALLLVFRTNSSYGRFDEARKLWGSNVNRTRDIARQALSWIQAPKDAERVTEFLRYLASYPFCLKDHLLPEDDLRRDLESVLQPKELEKLLASSHRPNHSVQMLSNVLAQCELSDMNRVSMDRNLTQLHDNIGGCERLFRTPIPVSYTRLISRFLVLWHIALPLCLWQSCGLLIVPATTASAAALFCIDEVLQS
eukprot:TRINITY_DN7057_c0_g2_i1.p1 TRINITY_DN7057_c0_g2~~TRINITY_DN7057_c0_g2_i1.p1  ORF type:complete len:358 (+),score=27.70 TRINITY_DN7057_c0_g2_i1:169-1242(+)